MIPESKRNSLLLRFTKIILLVLMLHLTSSCASWNAFIATTGGNPFRTDVEYDYKRECRYIEGNPVLLIDENNNTILMIKY